MPRDSVFITILRHPVSNFRSVFSYMEVALKQGISGEDNFIKMKNFLDNPKEYHMRLTGSGALTYNGQLYDLGLEAKDMINDALVQQHINRIAERFQLVMILEYIDESLVLMKRKLCWNLHDVAYFQFLKSARKREKLTKEVEEKIRKHNKADLKLYEYFNNTFWKQIRAEGPDFYVEVKLLAKLREKLRKQCIGDEKVVTAFAQTYSKVKTFEIRANISGPVKQRCCRMLREEHQYILHHRLRQTPGWSKFLSSFKCLNYER